MVQFSMLYYHMEMKKIFVFVLDNEHLYMDNDKHNNMHQLMRNQNNDPHFDKVLKHIEIQLEILLYLLK